LRNKELKVSRMMGYFLDATVEIIEQEGIENVTIRQIAERAGYNSATIYNYFQEVSHLIFFAAMKFLKKYTDALPGCIAAAENPVEKFLLVWDCFCRFSFAEPKIYHAIFTADLGSQPHSLLKNYYGTFPADLDNLPDELKHMLLEPDLSKRGRIALEECIKEGFIEQEKAEELNEMLILIWQGMLTMILNNRRSYTPQEAAEKTMKYIREIVRQHTRK
jgi:AcrR family transcriptional regulator